MSGREEFEAWYLRRFGKCDMHSGWAMERWEAWQACQDSFGIKQSDTPRQTGHAVPKWLRDHFSTIEDEAMQMGGCAVFTQMRTKVQAYFEMMRADLSYSVLLAERNQLKAENEDGLAVIRTQKQQLECYINDAERYRLLRDEKFHPGSLSSDPDKARWLDEYLMCGDKLDAAIDEQLAKSK